jgi:fucose permease
VGVIMVVYFLMAPMYPTIFTLGTASKSKSQIIASMHF